MEIKPLKDDLGVIAKAYKILPVELYNNFLESISKLENNDNHKNRDQQLRIHKIEGTGKENVYRADINKTKGWRIHFKYDDNNYIKLCDVLSNQEHDMCLKKVQDRKNRYK